MRTLPLAALVLLALLSACGSEPAPAPAASAPASAAAPTPAGDNAATATAPAAPAVAEMPLPSGDYRIVEVRLGKALDSERNVLAASEQFAPGDSFHVAVTGVGNSQGLTLSAQWRSGDGTAIARSEQVLVPTSPTITTFSLSHPRGWPLGRYQVEIAINGRAAENRSFEVR